MNNREVTTIEILNLLSHFLSKKKDDFFSPFFQNNYFATFFFEKISSFREAG